MFPDCAASRSWDSSFENKAGIRRISVFGSFLVSFLRVSAMLGLMYATPRCCVRAAISASGPYVSTFASAASTILFSKSGSFHRNMASIFISYRREDSAPYAGRLYDRLHAQFGAKHEVFMDIDTLQP